MRFEVIPMTEDRAREILAWRYEEPYAFYNAHPENLEEGLREMLAGTYYAVTDEGGEVVGFFAFGLPAQIPGAHDARGYADEALDIGLGMRPDLTGQGLGLDFVQAGLDFARSELSAGRFRLAVATFNQRAIRVYERAGFRPLVTVMSPMRIGETEFLLMLRDEN